MTALASSNISDRTSPADARSPRWFAFIWLALLAIAAVAVLRTNLTHLQWVSELSMQGSPPPPIDGNSPTGYAHGQRHFLGAQERGETYRWIAVAQDAAAKGPLATTTYESDSLPTGRPQLLPRLYLFWTYAIGWAIHVVTGDSLGLSIERAALWEPLISHLIALAGAAWFMGRRHGLAAAAMAAMVVAFFPPIASQFLPGVLTARTWALLLAALAIALNLPRSGSAKSHSPLSLGAAAAAAAALWLDPAFGFPAVLISAAFATAVVFVQRSTLPCLRWALVGSVLTLAAWLIDRAPWDPSASELRYLHPLYAFAWLGLGLALHGAQHLRANDHRRKLRGLEIAAAVPLIGALIYVQMGHAFKGWLYPSIWIRRFSSLDDSLPADHLLAWLGQASFLEAAFVAAPFLAAVALLAAAAVRFRRSTSWRESWIPALATLWLTVVLFATFRVRWSAVAILVALPLLWSLATHHFAARQRILGAIAASFVLALAMWNLALPSSWQRPSAGREPTQADLQALVYRHFAHWLASHSPPQSVAALAPPELSDSLVFHGASRVLMSTAWEAYPGQIATTRILSSLEPTEAEAVLGAHGVTHLVLPSWDKVLPLFVRKPEGEPREPLLELLQRWLHPAYLRPLPYHLPAHPGSRADHIVVFKVIPHEDEALSLSRLAEYFIEMERPEPAGLAARVLADAFPNDPNAAIARATFYASAQQPADLERELDRLASDVAADRVPFLWDRRVQRAIVFALGRRNDLARREVEACLAAASREELHELTPLQAYRLHTIARRLRITLPDPELAELLEQLARELSPAGSE